MNDLASPRSNGVLLLEVSACSMETLLCTFVAVETSLSCPDLVELDERGVAE